MSYCSRSQRKSHCKVITKGRETKSLTTCWMQRGIHLLKRHVFPQELLDNKPELKGKCIFGFETTRWPGVKLHIEMPVFKLLAWEPLIAWQKVCVVFASYPASHGLFLSVSQLLWLNSQMTIQVVKTMCPDITTLVHKQKSISQSLLGPNNVLNVLVYWLNSLLKTPPKKTTKKNKHAKQKI